MNSNYLYPCPCCGYLVFRMQPGGNERCPICLWEDDLAQLRFPYLPGSANHVSLEEAQQYDRAIGFSQATDVVGQQPVELLALESLGD